VDTDGTARGLLHQEPVSELIETTRHHLELNETVRLAVLTTFTVVLAVAFLALLVSDQVQAAGL
jgi:hypothetical protein